LTTKTDWMKDVIGPRAEALAAGELDKARMRHDRIAAMREEADAAMGGALEALRAFLGETVGNPIPEECVHSPDTKETNNRTTPGYFVADPDEQEELGVWLDYNFVSKAVILRHGFVGKTTNSAMATWADYCAVTNTIAVTEGPVPRKCTCLAYGIDKDVLPRLVNYLADYLLRLRGWD